MNNSSDTRHGTAILAEDWAMMRIGYNSILSHARRPLAVQNLLSATRIGMHVAASQTVAAFMRARICRGRHLAIPLWYHPDIS
jgi:hypothetical protein